MVGVDLCKDGATWKLDRKGGSERRDQEGDYTHNGPVRGADPLALDFLVRWKVSLLAHSPATARLLPQAEAGEIGRSEGSCSNTRILPKAGEEERRGPQDV